MKDQGYEHAHSSPIKTPMQLVVVTVLAFVIPVIGLILLAQFVISGYRAAQTAADPDTVARRIQPVARVEFADAAPAGGPRAAKSGEEVYKAVCAACHGTGAAGAWKFGDKAAWAPHLKEGLEALAKNAINGIRAMPPRGGNPDLSDLEVTRAVVYMGNAAGANFKEPAAPAAKPVASAAPVAAPAPAQVQAAAAPPATTPAPADAAALLQKSGCLACHQVDKKVVGPSYRDVAGKYAGDKNALALLEKKVKAGSVGVWGQVPMPPHPQLSDADVQAMVQYILAQK
jgi:cytochrome c5